MFKVSIKNFDLRIIANSGQCFRIYEIEKNIFYILSTNRFLRVDYLGNSNFQFYCSKKEFFSFYFHYFDLKNNYKKYIKCCRDDDLFLKKCILFGKGLKILNQDKFETIISFIISQRKSVKAIQTSIERLSKLCGKKIVNDYGTFYSFPTAIEILKCNSTKLLSCGMGYRTEYILKFCIDYINGLYDLESFNKLNDDELIDKLLSIKGVGIKVASCIALFAYHRFSICPKDVWINRVINDKYNGKIPEEYIKYLGIIQQYWFNFARLSKLKV